MKLIIAGSRNFTDYERLEKEVIKFLKYNREYQGEPIEIISGCARGADKLGIQFGEKFGLEIHKMPADWNAHGKAAGHIRNREMAKIGTHCICFWDGKSSGTKGMIELAKKKNLKHEVIYL